MWRAAAARWQAWPPPAWRRPRRWRMLQHRRIECWPELAALHSKYLDKPRFVDFYAAIEFDFITKGSLVTCVSSLWSSVHSRYIRRKKIGRLRGSRTGECAKRHQRPCRCPLRPKRAALALWATPVHASSMVDLVESAGNPVSVCTAVHACTARACMRCAGAETGARVQTDRAAIPLMTLSQAPPFGMHS